MWELHGHGAHLHAVDEHVELAVAPLSVAWLNKHGALLELLSEAAGRQVVLIPCSVGVAEGVLA